MMIRMRSKITAVILSFVMSMSMLMPSFEVMADETTAPSETQKTESIEKEEPKVTEKQALKETEKQDSKETETQEPKETEKQEPKGTETQEPKETEKQEPKETETQAPNETEKQESKETETQEPKETEKQENDPVKETDPSEPEKQVPENKEKQDAEQIAKVTPKYASGSITRERIDSVCSEYGFNKGTSSNPVYWTYDWTNLTKTQSVLDSAAQTGYYASHTPKGTGSEHYVSKLFTKQTGTHKGYLEYGQFVFNGKIECYGFAEFLGYKLTGKYPSTQWTHYTSVSEVNNAGGIQVGDVIRAGGHSAMVLSVSGSTFRTVEVWSSEKNRNKIAYNTTFNSYYNTIQDVSNAYKGITYVARYNGTMPSLPSNTWIKSSCGTSTTTNTNVTLTWGANNTASYWLHIYKDGVDYYNEGQEGRTSWSHTFTQAGTYTCYITPYGKSGYQSASEGPNASVTITVNTPDPKPTGTWINSSHSSSQTGGNHKYTITFGANNAKGYRLTAYKDNSYKYIDKTFNDDSGSCSYSDYSVDECVMKYVVVPFNDYGDGPSATVSVVVFNPTITETLSGKCGDNLEWTLEPNGVLSITGTGDMYDYGKEAPPWYDYKNVIAKIEISKGVKSIGRDAFCYHKKIVSITIPEGVTSIGAGAFAVSQNLSSVTLPSSLRTIGAEAFTSTAITDISIPYGVTSIEKHTFSSCENLKEVNLPDSVTYIGDYAFYSSGSLESINIPKGVTTIGDNAFLLCSALSKVSLPDSLTSIGDAAFMSCKNLKSITIPKNVNTIGVQAFRDCSSVSSVSILGEIQNISGSCFCGLSNMKTITIPESVTSISDNAFYECSAITDVYFGGTESDWKAISVVGGSSGHNSTVLSANIHYGKHTLTLNSTVNGSASLSSYKAKNNELITVKVSPDEGFELDYITVNNNEIDGNSFNMPDSDVTVGVFFKKLIHPSLGEEVEINDFVYRITNADTLGNGTATLVGMVYSTPVISIPATVVIKGASYKVNRIGTKAFYGDKTLTTLNIGPNIVIIDPSAFYGCSNLVKVSGGIKLKSIGSSAFGKCTKLKTFVITSSVLSKIGPSAFYKDSKLKTISIKNTTKLTKSGVKKSLKGSKVKTVKVKKSKVKKYKKYFKKSNSGRSVKVKK